MEDEIEVAAETMNIEIEVELELQLGGETVIKEGGKRSKPNTRNDRRYKINIKGN